METLKTMLEKHPELADLPMAVLTPSGESDYIGEAGGWFIYGADFDEEEHEGYVEEMGHEPIVTLMFYAN